MIFLIWLSFVVVTYLGIQFLFAGVCVWLFDNLAGAALMLFGSGLIAIAIHFAPFTITFSAS